jgi:hypothetical protein
MATELLKRIIHDWSTGELVITEVEITEEEHNPESQEIKFPDA